MEKYLKIGLGIIIAILLLQFAFFILPYVIIGGLILIFIGWVYFKFIRKYVIKRKNKKSTTETYSYKFTKEEYKSESEMQDDGPVIDVDFEEVKDDK
ncbi:hypothetical protein GNF80_07395 [Clostridium perfringens]|nr:hypothetical protein [Clostridium perfringens]